MTTMNTTDSYTCSDFCRKIITKNQKEIRNELWLLNDKITTILGGYLCNIDNQNTKSSTQISI